jgi:hypothetical protein
MDPPASETSSGCGHPEITPSAPRGIVLSWPYTPAPIGQLYFQDSQHGGSVPSLGTMQDDRDRNKRAN